MSDSTEQTNIAHAVRANQLADSEAKLLNLASSAGSDIYYLANVVGAAIYTLALSVHNMRAPKENTSNVGAPSYAEKRNMIILPNGTTLDTTQIAAVRVIENYKIPGRAHIIFLLKRVGDHQISLDLELLREHIMEPEAYDAWVQTPDAQVSLQAFTDEARDYAEKFAATFLGAKKFI